MQKNEGFYPVQCRITPKYPEHVAASLMLSSGFCHPNRPIAVTRAQSSFHELHIIHAPTLAGSIGQWLSNGGSRFDYFSGEATRIEFRNSQETELMPPPVISAPISGTWTETIVPDSTNSGMLFALALTALGRSSAAHRRQHMKLFTLAV